VSEDQPRPGDAYVPTLEARLEWTSRRVTIPGRDGEPGRTVDGVQLAADVAEVLAELGVLAGEEHHHEITDSEITELAEFLHRLLPPDSLARRRYPEPGDVLRGPADLLLVVQDALRGAYGDGGVRDAVRRAERAIAAWMEDRGP
jgi:hypothetical protein